MKKIELEDVLKLKMNLINPKHDEVKEIYQHDIGSFIYSLSALFTIDKEFVHINEVIPYNILNIISGAISLEPKIRNDENVVNIYTQIKGLEDLSKRQQSRKRAAALVGENASRGFPLTMYQNISSLSQFYKKDYENFVNVIRASKPLDESSLLTLLYLKRKYYEIIKYSVELMGIYSLLPAVTFGDTTDETAKILEKLSKTF